MTDQNMVSHIIKQRLEEAAWLEESGCHITEVARRLGITVETLEKERDRERARSS